MTNIQNAASALTHRTGERTGTSVTGNNVQLLHYGGSGTIIKGYEPALGCLAPIGSLERPADKTGQLLVQSHDPRGVSIVYTGAAADGPRVEMSRVCFLYAVETQRRSTPAKKQKWLPLFVQSHATEPAEALNVGLGPCGATGVPPRVWQGLSGSTVGPLRGLYCPLRKAR